LGAEFTFQDSDLFRHGDNLVISGAFTGHIADRRVSEIPDDATGKGTHVLGRIAYKLWSDRVSSVQIGGSFARILTVGGAEPGLAGGVSLEDRPEIRIVGDPLVSTRSLPAKGGALWGLEAAANFGSLYFGGELYRFGLDRDTECSGCIDAADPDFSGWYVEGSWILSGEAKVYQPSAMNNGMATFTNPRVARPFPLDGWGAWEIAARYSDLDLNWSPGTADAPCGGASAGCVRGGDQQIWTFGLNWYLSDSVRLLFDVLFVDVDKLDSSGIQIGQAFSVVGTRLQFTN